ncbi:MAG TPA: AAA family ATPase [Vicinamibacterales bacterium]|nr:AAA family ATPase [Vicinamibacterales bacterium]
MATFFDRGPRADGGPGTGMLSAVPTDPRFSDLTYEPFYGLREKPFSLASDARFFYQSRSHAPAFVDLLNAVKRRESLTVLTGDIGTGKTTLCRSVLANLDHKTFSAFVPDPFASREDLIKMLLTDFGVASGADVTSGRLRDASRLELTYLLRDFLGTLAPLQAFAVVFVDEAQNLSLPLLEELRILSDADGQMQVVLVGQLELGEKLRLPAMRQLDQRVSARCRLQPLDVAGVAGYISHRLHRAGGSADRISFSGDAVELIYELSGGVPRLINRLCDRALHVAYGRKIASIDREIVEATNPNTRVVSAPEPAATALVVSVPAAPAPPAPPPTAAASSVSALTEFASETVAPKPRDPVDAWLNRIEDPAITSPEASRERKWETSGHAASDRHAGGRPRLQVRIGYAPQNRARVTSTHVPRKWTRRLEVLALSLVLLLVALMIGPSMWDAGTDAWVYVAQQFGAPAPPPTPSRPVAGIAPPPTQSLHN